MSDSSNSPARALRFLLLISWRAAHAQIRYMNSTGKKVMLEADDALLDVSPSAGLAGTSGLRQAMSAETRNEEEDDEPVANQELTTLNLIDKVGSSSSPSRSDGRS